MLTPFSPALDISAAVRRRDVSPVEVTQLYLDRIDRFDDDLGAIVWIDAEASLAEARRAEQAVMDGDELGPLHGVPFPVKDLHAAAGQPLFMGSLGVRERVQVENEPGVGLLRAAGATLLGRSHAPEAGTMCVTETSRFGTARNPWDLSRSPGGSSGGAAAAVAAGLAPFAHASDGGGSVRGPASACGLVGLKPSRGRVSTRHAGWEHAATEGVETRTIADTATILDVMSVFEPRAMYNAPAPGGTFAEAAASGANGAVPKLRIGLVTEAPGGLPVDEACIAAATSAAKLLADLGHEVVPFALRTYSAEAVTGYITHIMDAAVATIPFDDPEAIEPYLKVRRARALEASAADYVASAMRIQDESWHIVSQFGRDIDIVLSPTMARPPAPAGELVAEANAQPHEMRLREAQMVAFTSWVNLAGLPAISLPLHTASDGLPIGVQLVGGPWGEATLLALAASIEQAVPWAGIVPPAFAVHAEPAQP
ncbi:amidase [Pseudoclavibacter endophyticus]|uniref:Amidase n=1 Tax=Pseudoclavibacter endophyticus TaxID=1778590 RepID=A0A6H9WRC9_9MICO|nr:amidase [Pseudoclavibacter endophyticus]KAB1648890.1 amidase [Pseudoclavibacter endophyticus]GGA67473.1 amidase [Pseudoclavibacter endophyticus]